MILVFLHIAAMNQAYDVVRDIVHAIHFSGLYEKVDRIRCFMAVLDEGVASRIRGLLARSGARFELVQEAPNDTSYERLTLLRIFDFVRPEDRILYLHSKGVSDRNVHNPNVHDWTYMMTYFLIGHFGWCLDRLSDHDVVGCNAGQDHCSGNFWWARGDYFLRLPREIGPGYWDPELAFLFRAGPRVCQPHGSGIDHYQTAYPPSAYVDGPGPPA